MDKEKRNVQQKVNIIHDLRQENARLGSNIRALEKEMGELNSRNMHDGRRGVVPNPCKFPIKLRPLLSDCLSELMNDDPSCCCIYLTVCMLCSLHIAFFC